MDSHVSITFKMIVLDDTLKQTLIKEKKKCQRLFVGVDFISDYKNYKETVN